jgi:hypothetical protein
MLALLQTACYIPRAQAEHSLQVAILIALFVWTARFGTDVMILQMFSPKNLAKNCFFFLSNSPVVQML